MKDRWKRVRTLVLATFGAAFLCGCIHYAICLRSWWRLGHDRELWESKKDLVVAAYRTLRLPSLFDPHDAFAAILEYGDPASVPYLLQGLRKQPETQGVMGCTKLHCLDALRKYTGEDHGDNYADWADWWSRSGRQIPQHTITFPAIVTTNWVRNAESRSPGHIIQFSCMTESGEPKIFQLVFIAGGQVVGGDLFPALPKLKIGDTCTVTVAALWLGDKPRVRGKKELCGKLTALVRAEPGDTNFPSKSLEATPPSGGAPQL